MFIVPVVACQATTPLTAQVQVVDLRDGGDTVLTLPGQVSVRLKSGVRVTITRSGGRDGAGALEVVVEPLDLGGQVAGVESTSQAGRRLASVDLAPANFGTLEVHEGLRTDNLVTQRFQLRHLNAQPLLGGLLAKPGTVTASNAPVGEWLRGSGLHGIEAVLGYPLDNSLIVRGTEAGCEALKAAIAIVDVPAQGDRLSLTLRRANAERVRKAALSLPAAGRVEIEGKTLRCAGSPGWLMDVRALVVHEETRQDAAGE